MCLFDHFIPDLKIIVQIISAPEINLPKKGD